MRLAPACAAALLAARAVAPADAARTAEALDDAQRAWLAARGAVRAAPERDYGPFVYAEGGSIQGLSIDMLGLVQQHTGLQLRWLPPAPLRDLLAAARAGEADLLTSLRPTPERAAFLRFSQPYVRVPAIVVVRRADAAVLPQPPWPALQGRPVAVGAGYAVEAPMREAHPAVAWRPVADDEQALLGVAEGRFQAAVVDAASAAFVLRRRALRDLESAGEAGFVYELAFAVRRDEPQLLAIVDAGLRAITAAERQAVLDRWLGALGDRELAQRAPAATRLGWALLLLALAAAVAVAVGRRRRR